VGIALEYHHDPDDDSDLPPLPSKILSRAGTIVETSAPVWLLTSASSLGPNHQLNWDLLD
jgi:hypothetical protein